MEEGYQEQLSYPGSDRAVVVQGGENPEYWSLLQMCSPSSLFSSGCVLLAVTTVNFVGTSEESLRLVHR